jgi:hypothetical protein
VSLIQSVLSLPRSYKRAILLLIDPVFSLCAFWLVLFTRLDSYTPLFDKLLDRFYLRSTAKFNRFCKVRPLSCSTELYEYASGLGYSLDSGFSALFVIYLSFGKSALISWIDDKIL